MAAAGAMTTTPAEGVGRADVVVVLSSASDAPLMARLAGSRPSRGTEPAKGGARNFVFVGPLDPGAAVGENVGEVCTIEVDGRDLAATVGALRAVVNGRMLAETAGAALEAAAGML